jgi:hypothetical protein
MKDIKALIIAAAFGVFVGVVILGASFCILRLEQNSHRIRQDAARDIEAECVEAIEAAMWMGYKLGQQDSEQECIGCVTHPKGSTIPETSELSYHGGVRTLLGH